MESMYDLAKEVGEFADSPAMQLIRQGREEAWKEAQQQIKKEREKAEAEREKAEAERKAVIRNLLKAGMEPSSIATIMGLSPEKFQTYLQEMQDEASDADPAD